MHSHTPSHCADAVLSLSNVTTVVSRVSCTLADFCESWVRTASGYDVLFATTMRDDWARRHRPVLSTDKDCHTLYTGYIVTEPYGRIVQCHQGCSIENRRHNVTARKVTIFCKQCNSSCTIDKVPSETTILGSRSIVKTPYPPPLVKTEWRYEDSTAKAEPKVSTTSHIFAPAASITTERSASITDLASISTQNRVLPPIHPTVTSQMRISRPTFLSPPPAVMSRSTSLPAPSSNSHVDPLVSSSSIEQQALLPDDQPPIPATVLPFSTSTPTTATQRNVPPTDPSTSTQPPRLTIKLPARAQSLPQLQGSLKRQMYAPLELSTSTQRKSKKNKMR
jgi:hypothetical protein